MHEATGSNLKMSKEQHFFLPCNRGIEKGQFSIQNQLSNSIFRNYDQEEAIVVTNMITSESDPSLTETAPSTSRSESSDSVTFIFNNRQIECLIHNDEDESESDNAGFNECDKIDNIHPQLMFHS